MKCLKAILILCLFSVILAPTARAEVSIQSHSEATVYSSATWPSEISGTFDNPDTDKIKVSIRRGTEYWGGSGWVPGPEILLDATLLPDYFEYLFDAPDISGNYILRALAFYSDGQPIPNEEDTKTIAYDIDPPSASFDPPLPKWTNKAVIELNFIAEDDSGIKPFMIKYKVTRPDSSIEQDWTPLIEDYNFTGSSFYSFGQSTYPIINNYTYHFNLTVEDNAGNPNTTTQNTTIDNLKPICEMTSPSQYSPLPFTISWSVTETMSGLMDLQVEYLTEGNPWQDASGPCEPYTKSSTSTICDNVQDNTLYQFRCSAKDNAENTGDYSSIVNTTVDTTEPISSIASPVQEYTNSQAFTLSWSSDESGSGIQCYYVQWNSTRVGWTDIQNPSGGTCLDLTEITFGDGGIEGDPVIGDSEEGEKYFFQVKAEDNVNNLEDWPENPKDNTTIDTKTPSLEIHAKDQNGNPLGLGAITELKVDTTALDQTSGISSHIIFIEVTKDSIYLYSSDHCLTSEICNLTQDVSGADQVIYYAQAKDNAGNTNETPHFVFAAHPLANFVSRDITLTMGAALETEVQFRNTNQTPINISLKLEEYQPAGFTACSGDFDSCNISLDGRTANITEIKPGGTGLLKLELIPADPQDYTNYLNLTAASTYGLADNDIMNIQVRFHASFPGLNEYALALLVLLSVFAFSLTKRKH